MNIDKIGLLAKTRKTLGRMRRRIFRTNAAHWYCKNLERDKYHFFKRNPELKFDFYNYSETSKWIRAHCHEFPWILNLKQFECAEKYSHFYPSLKYNGSIVGFTKIGIVRVYIEDYEGEIDLSNDEAFIYDTFIHPEFRRKHLGAFMLKRIICEIKKNDFSYIFCHIPSWNVASIKLYQSLGFTRVSHVRYVRLLKFHFFSNSPTKVREIARRLK